MMELTMDPGTSAHRRVFRIDHPQVVAILGENHEERKFFSFAEIAAVYETWLNNLRSSMNAERRDTYQRALVKLQNAIGIYDGLAYTLTTSPTFGGMDREQQIIRLARADLANQPMGSDTHTLANNALELMSGQYRRIAMTAVMQAIPPSGGAVGWRNLGDAMLQGVNTGEFHPVLAEYGQLAEAWRNKEVIRFNEQIQGLYADLHIYAGERSNRIKFEHFFHNFAPFYFSMEVYVIVFFTALFSWLFWTRTLTVATFWLMVTAFVLHTFGLAARVYIQERPPVTNLYSSAVFVGWAAVLICLFLERLYKNCVSAAAAAMIGFCTLIIAHHLSFTGDTLEVMRAVLDSNFWLATHVPTVTMGYSAAFLAGFLGILHIVRDRVWGGLPEDTGRSIERMVYGVVCF
ncbi:MAG: hypothetical protein LR015_13210, partial [Verrucomicrobia bacterium]|nr:hypothetical protein [Verrucomicrobiota bacterium]